ncbi:MAG: MFS transporter, partial [Thermodesulfobacteriota bacterium]
MGSLRERLSLHILSGQYFLHFAVMGIVLPYFNLYCYHLGLTGFEIGIVSALRSVSLVIFSLIWSGLADRFSARKPIFIFCLFASTGIWTFFFYTQSFQGIFLTTLVYGVFYSPVIAFLEAFTMDWLGENKRSYGQVRAWGSISFIVMVIL